MFTELGRIRVNLNEVLAHYAAYKRLSINDYSHFSFYMVVIFYKVAINTEIEIARGS